MGFISNYDIPEPVYKPLDKLYLISTNPNVNYIKKVIVNGLEYKFYVDKNLLFYNIIEFPVLKQILNRFETTVESCVINSLEPITYGAREYFIASSEEKVKQLKLEYLKSKVKELEELQKDLN